MSDEGPIDLVPMIQHRLLLDILPHEEVPKFWGLMSLVPPGPDVLTTMQDESVARMSKVAPLIAPVEMFIVLTADIITEAMFYRLMQRLDPDDARARETAASMRPVMTNQNREVVRASLYSSLAHLLDSGYIRLVPQAVA